MKILITGAAGFIGSNLVGHLLAKGREVVGFDNLLNPSLLSSRGLYEGNHNYRFYKGDIRDAHVLESVFLNEKPDAVVHLAAVGSVPKSFEQPGLVTAVNCLGFVTLLSVMQKCKIKKLVYASSSSVYGSNNLNVKIEGEEGAALSPYSLSKKFNEDFARIWWAPHGVAVGLRFFNVYGPGQRFDSDFSAVIPKFINVDLPTVNGDGSTTRDFTYVGDVCAAIERSLGDVPGGVYNVGTGRGTRLKDICGLLHKPARIGPPRFGDVDCSIASTAKAEVGLGFKAQVAIAEGLSMSKAFYDELRGSKRGR